MSTSVVLDDHALGAFPGLDAALARAGALVMRSFKNTPNPALLAQHPGVGVVGGPDKAGLLARLERATTTLASVPAPVIGVVPRGISATPDLLGPGVVDLLSAGTSLAPEYVAERILLMARVPVVTGGPKGPRATTDPGTAAPTARPLRTRSPLLPSSPSATPEEPEHVVAVASSTGGVWVLGAMLRDLAPQRSAVLIAQHMEAEFVTFLAQWLEGVSGWRTVLVEDTAMLEAGVAFVPGGGKDLIAEDDRVRAVTSTSRFVPSGDRLLASVGRMGARATGMVLSGMGSDGAIGLAELVRLGGNALCQDPSTATVPSMPESALRAAPRATIVTPDGLATAVNAIQLRPVFSPP